MNKNESTLIQLRTILIYSNNQSAMSELESLFFSEGYSFVFSDDIIEVHDYLKFSSPAAIIMDISSTESSESLIKKLRNTYKGTLILLTEIKEAKHHIKYLKLGVDDILNKGMDANILAESIMTIVSKQKSHPDSRNNTVNIGDLCINGSRREVFVSKKPINLNTVEFEILWHLTKNAGKTVSRNELHRELYNTDYNGIERALDIYVSRIRSKLCDNPRDPKYIKTVRGEGYLFLPL
jgi:two-component system response regulator RstA